MSENRIHGLAHHLRLTTHPIVDRPHAEDVAAGIIVNPQAHIDALVEAGVLERTIHSGHALTGPYSAYRIAEPHVHDWFVSGVDPIGDRTRTVGDAVVYCECGAAKIVPNRLPIEVPE